MRRQRHRFLAAGDDDVGVAGRDLLHAERNGPQAGAADLIEAPRGRFLGQAGKDRSLARRVLPLRGGQHLAEDDLVHLGGLDTGARQKLADDGRAELMGGGVGERPVERADGRARGTGDDDGIGSRHFVLRSMMAIRACPLFLPFPTGESNRKWPPGPRARRRQAARRIVLRFKSARALSHCTKRLESHRLCAYPPDTEMPPSFAQAPGRSPGEC